MKRCVYALAADSDPDGATASADVEDSSGTRYAAGVAVAGRLKSGPTAQAARPAAASTVTSRRAATQRRRVTPPSPAKATPRPHMDGTLQVREDALQCIPHSHRHTSPATATRSPQTW